MRAAGAGAAVALCAAMASQAYAASGEEVYRKRCASCHEQSNPRIPPREALQKMPARRILRTLDFGAMMTVAYPLSRDERVAVSDYLGVATPPPMPVASAICRDRRVSLPDRSTPSWNGWSPTGSNDRYQPPEIAGLTATDVPRLSLKWAFGFEDDVTAFAQPTVVGQQVFVGSAAGIVHALRADTGCVQWTFQANGPVRSSVVVTPRGAGHALLFGDQTGWFYALEAESGRLLWKQRVEQHDAARLTASPVVFNDRVFVPVSSWEETRSLDPAYACCTFRGSIVALRVGDGVPVWQTYLVPEAKRTGANKRGTPQFGPSGAGVWATPTIDVKRGLMYVATGDNYSSPASPLSDAIVALDIKSGRVVWSKQTLPGDAYNSSCGTDKENCPSEDGPDYDFGASAVLARLQGGRDVLVAGQKSGMVYALDPDARGKILWQTRIASPGANVGPSVGVQWGMASDGTKVYGAASNFGRTRPTDPLETRRYILDPQQGGGLTALNLADGAKAWYASAIVCRPGAPSGCSPAQSAALTAIAGAVFSGSLDGHIRAYAAEDGRVIWDFDTAREFQTVNGVKAAGGSIDGPGPVVVNGLVLVTSGYSRFGGIPGNVLLAFAPK